jgi:hypothetical protein
MREVTFTGTKYRLNKVDFPKKSYPRCGCRYTPGP